MSWLGEVGDVVETGSGRGSRDSVGVFSSFEWSIPLVPSLTGEGGDRYGSPDFDACGGKWFLKIYPDGLSRDITSEGVSLALFRKDEGPSQTLDVTLGIRVAEGVENKRRRIQEFSKDDRECFWTRFYSKSKLRELKSRLMPGNVLIVSLDMKSAGSRVARDSSTQTVEVSKEDEVPTEENLFSEKPGVEELQKSLHGLLAGGEDSDVLIRVRGKEFPAHRAILRARSAVFQAMFAHDMVEKQSGKVNMEDCDPESFPDFLEHVYTGSTQMISAGNVFSLYVSADKYDLSMLKKECVEFVKNNLSVSCFCEAITLAVKHDEKELIECATQFFCSNALEIFKTVEWQIFLKENTTIGNELLIKAFSK